jgi:ABC-type dipeptide/oligopeptide/nickel transport system ATPase component
LSLLEVDDLHVWFDLPRGGQVHAAAGVSFSLDPGERLGQVGEDGCGKTTTILALMGLRRPTRRQPEESGGREQHPKLHGDYARRTAGPGHAMVFQGAMNARNW